MSIPRDDDAASVRNHSCADLISELLQQNPDLSASEGKVLANNTIATLKELQKDEKFESFWHQIMAEIEKLKSEYFEISEPTLPRPKRLPVRFRDESDDDDDNNVSPPETPKEYYQKIHFEALEKLIEFLTERFTQP